MTGATISYHLSILKKAELSGRIKDPKKNIPNLMQYAKELRVQKRVKDLIGVWL